MFISPLILRELQGNRTCGGKHLAAHFRVDSGYLEKKAQRKTTRRRSRKGSSEWVQREEKSCRRLRAVTGGRRRVKASQLGRGRLEIKVEQAHLQRLPLAPAHLQQAGAGVNRDKPKCFPRELPS